jgi:perosamine synthetase
MRGLLPLTKPDITFEEVQEDLRTIFKSGRLTSGQYVEAFEHAVAARVGVEHAVATSSCTAALHLALSARGIGRGDEVLVSDFTFPATGNAVIQTGAVPVMVDCLPDSFLMDVDDAASKMTSRTAAIVPVDPFGLPVDMPKVVELAQRHGLFVLEDAACAIGADKGGQPCGSWPDAGAFSFHPRKVVTTGEGGMVTSHDGDLAKKLRLLRNHGATLGEAGMSYVFNGYNYRLSEVQAAIGIAQMRRLEAILADRYRTATRYAEFLSELPGTLVPKVELEDTATYQSFVVMLDEAFDRDDVIRALREHDVESTLGTYALHAQPAFERFGYAPGQLPHSWRAQSQSLTLPLLPRMTEELTLRVRDALAHSLDRAKR